MSSLDNPSVRKSVVSLMMLRVIPRLSWKSTAVQCLRCLDPVCAFVVCGATHQTHTEGRCRHTNTEHTPSPHGKHPPMHPTEFLLSPLEFLKEFPHFMPPFLLEYLKWLCLKIKCAKTKKKSTDLIKYKKNCMHSNAFTSKQKYFVFIVAHCVDAIVILAVI